MGDYFIRVTAAGGRIRGFFATTGELVEFARKAHNTSPVVTAALGRLLTGGVMMGAMMKNDADLLTIKINGDGPIGGLTVTADANGNVKGYANNPVVMIPANDKGKLDVASAVGVGVLQVIKDIGLKEPYIGDTILVTSEIAEDLTYYFATSEQTPSSVGLGVLMSKDNTVKCAGGMILQLMPDADESVISLLEERLKEVTSITALLEKGMTPEDICMMILHDMQPEISRHYPCRFTCDCSKTRVGKALISIGKKELDQMIEDGKEIEVNCHFCNTNYYFSVEELKELRDLA
jgi:molecular chaperone Hsp33